MLTLVSDLIPNNDANAVWLAAVIAFCTVVFFQISDRYWNPMALRSKRSGQEPLISKMCVATEVAITAIFSQVSMVKATEGESEDARGFRLRFNNN